MDEINSVNRKASMLLPAIVFEVSLAGLALVLAWLLGSAFLEKCGFNAKSLLLGCAATLPMLTLYALLLRVKSLPFQKITNVVETLVQELFPKGSLLGMAILALAAGIGEEFLFRGFLQTWIGEWTSPVWGIVLSALVFGLVHCITKIYFILATLIGLYLGVLYHATDSLWVPTIAHALYDFLILLHVAHRLKRKQQSQNCAS